MQININYKATKGRGARRSKFRKVSKKVERERERVKSKWNECLNLLCCLNYVRIYIFLFKSRVKITIPTVPSKRRINIFEVSATSPKKKKKKERRGE